MQTVEVSAYGNKLEILCVPTLLEKIMPFDM